jgi:PHD/YefM family antitoxin component YafN of YafNO toxin-antitoxin module
METIRVTASEFERAFGELTEKAAREPATIIREGGDDRVVLSAEEYARLKRRDRRVGLASEFPRNGWRRCAAQKSRMNTRISTLN